MGVWRLWGSGGGLGHSGNRQRLVLGTRGASIIVVSFCWTRQLLWSKMTVHPLSQSLAMESRELEARPGRIWPARAVAGRFVRSRSQV